MGGSIAADYPRSHVEEAVMIEPVLKACVRALELSLSSNNSHICENESQLASLSSKLAAAADNISMTELCLYFAEDAVPALRENVQVYEFQLHDAEAVSPGDG